MRDGRLAIAGAALAAIIVLTGCNGDSGSPSAAPASTTVAADPAADFGAAAAQLADTSVKLKMTMLGGIEMTGAVDAKNRKSEVSSDFGSAGSMNARQIGNDLYVKATGQLTSVAGAPSGKWMHLDTSKAPAGSPLNMAGSDPKQIAELLTSSADVTRTGANSYAGKLDFTKSPTFKSLGGASADTSGAADKLKAVPFTARTDPQGRLTNLDINLDAVAPGAGQMAIEYTDFGAPVNVPAPPSSQVVPMPEKFRKAMAG